MARLRCTTRSTGDRHDHARLAGEPQRPVGTARRGAVGASEHGGRRRHRPGSRAHPYRCDVLCRRRPEGGGGRGRPGARHGAHAGAAAPDRRAAQTGDREDRRQRARRRARHRRRLRHRDRGTDVVLRVHRGAPRAGTSDHLADHAGPDERAGRGALLPHRREVRRAHRRRQRVGDRGRQRSRRRDHGDRRRAARLLAAGSGRDQAADDAGRAGRASTKRADLQALSAAALRVGRGARGHRGVPAEAPAELGTAGDK